MADNKLSFKLGDGKRVEISFGDTMDTPKKITFHQAEGGSQMDPIPAKDVTLTWAQFEMAVNWKDKMRKLFG